MKALTISNLSYSYQADQIVIDDISLDISKGKYVSLLGHNGSGKSTLAKLIVGLLPNYKGKIMIGDLELNEKNISKIRDKIAIVFQNPDNQFIGITVEDDIAFSLENRNIPREKMIDLVHEYAKKVGMSEFLSKEPAYLSGGQKQRVAIADALVINPEILILDEATSMLDPRGKKDILSLVKKMREENPDLTVISITHDVDEAFLSDEVVLLEKGKVVAQGHPTDLFGNEKIIEKYNLAIPFEIAIKNVLKEHKIETNESDTLENLGEKICQLR